MTSIVTASTSRSVRFAPETWPALSQPQHQGQLVLLQKHDQHCQSHNIKVSYSCSRNMTSIVTATTSRSSTLAPERWHEEHCHSHRIKVSYSCSRNMNSIVTATTSRSATLAPETWTALSQPQHQGQPLLPQKHEQHCHSHNIKVIHSYSRKMTWRALSQPQHQGQLLLPQKHNQHCHSHNIKVS